MLMLEKGRGARLQSGQSTWCTRCTIYFLVDVIVPDRYYFTATARSLPKSIYSGRSQTNIINHNKVRCFEYYVDNENNDLVVTTRAFQGTYDLFVSARTTPTGPADTSIDAHSSRDETRMLIVSAEDRISAGFRTGAY